MALSSDMAAIRSWACPASSMREAYRYVKLVGIKTKSAAPRAIPESGSSKLEAANKIIASGSQRPTPECTRE
eukprot:1776112-Pyramimonas_sp.AAC.1